jgi:hypothetical protein
MNKILELASAFYGVFVPRTKRKNFLRLVLDYLGKRYSIETAIGLALTKLKIN